MQQVNNVIIRPLQEADIVLIATIFNFPWTTHLASMEKWKMYYKEHAQSIRYTFVIEKNSKIIGYCNLLHKSQYEHFKHNSIPEISDLWILESERAQGYGSQLIAHAEQYAKAAGCKQIGLAVGLYGDYGSAQKLYVKLGYVPDGKGITYKNISVIPGESYSIDDDLVLWLVKNL